MQAGDFGAPGAGLDVELEDQALAVASPPAQNRPPAKLRRSASGISSTWSSTISTSGERSTLASGGTHAPDRLQERPGHRIEQRRSG